METMKERYVNASFLMAGCACLAMVVNHLAISFSPYSLESAIPGWSFMASLANPVLFAWVGLLLRRRSGTPRKWLPAAVAVLVLFLLGMYHHYLGSRGWWERFPFLFLASLGLGYLVPPSMISEAGRRKGAEYLVLLICSVFSYTACAVVSGRIQWGGMPPELHEMTDLMVSLMDIAEPLLAVIVLYFAVMFSFSEYGQWLGERSWFRGIAIGVAAYAFLLSLGNLAWGLFHRWMFLAFFVQPVTVYLAIVLCRLIRRKAKGGEPASWKESFKL